MRTFSRIMRIISAIILFFFCWTYLPIYQVAAYAAEKKQHSAISAQQSKGKQQADRRKLKADSSHKFEKAIESIREKLEKAEKKAAKGKGVTSELEHLKAKKREIALLDIELKKEFAATEKRLKKAKLSKKITSRHSKFVKHYEDNLAALKAELDGIEKAKTKTARKRKIKQAKKHLDKVKPPKRHTPLDPNKLPHRLRKVKKPRKPRTTRKQFEKEFGPQKKKRARRKGQVATRYPLPDPRPLITNNNPASGIWHPVSDHKPLLVASSGPLTGLMDQGNHVAVTPHPVFSASPIHPVPDLPFNVISPPSSPLVTASGRIVLAQASPAPTADDLSETPEVRFTQEIQDLAAQLDHKPLKIYEWVRNNIEFVPTYGSIQGAQMTLETKMGNAFDTASLLIALLRVSGIHAKYVYGTVDIPVEKVMNWVGGVTDPKVAGTILATNGIPAILLKTSEGVYKHMRMEHVWVKAFVDYIPSRGAIHRQGDTWIPLDASFKQYTYTEGIDIKAAVPFDGQAFANQLQSTATINEAEGYVTNADSLLVQQTMQSYQTQVQNYIQQHYPNATVGDVIGKKEIITKEYPILLGTLPYKTIRIGSEFAQVPTNQRATMSFSVVDPLVVGPGLSYATTLPEIAGKKITLSFSPATPEDQAVIKSYLPAPHPDGTPIDPSELPTSLPAYLINLKPELRIEGQIVATGSAASMGKVLNFTMSLIEPGVGRSNIINSIIAGEYFSIGLNTGKITADRLDDLRSKLELTRTKIESGDYQTLTKDNLVGDLFYATITSYFAELDAGDDIGAKTFDLIRYRATSIGLFSMSLDVRGIFSIPMSARANGLMMDVDRIVQAVFSKDGNMENVKRYMLTSGANSSILEHSVPERLYSTTESTTEGISAVKALHIANNEGVPIYKIDRSNMDNILPQLEIDQDVMNSIKDALNAGKKVTVSKTNISFNGWTGCGYIIIDPSSGAGAYMISSGQNGSWVPVVVTVLIVIAVLALIAACILSGVCAIIAAALLNVIVTVGNAIISALSAIATAVRLLIIAARAWAIAARAWALYALPFLFGAYEMCSQLPPDVSIWVEMVCDGILMIILIVMAGRR